MANNLEKTSVKHMNPKYILFDFDGVDSPTDLPSAISKYFEK
jgi:hypothetical protein